MRPLATTCHQQPLALTTWHHLTPTATGCNHLPPPVTNCLCLTPLLPWHWKTQPLLVNRNPEPWVERITGTIQYKTSTFHLGIKRIENMVQDFVIYLFNKHLLWFRSKKNFVSVFFSENFALNFTSQLE